MGTPTSSFLVFPTYQQPASPVNLTRTAPAARSSRLHETLSKQGDPRAMMLSVVPVVVAIAEEALGRRLEHHPSTRARLTAAAAEADTSLSTRPMGSRADSYASKPCLGSGPLLLLGFLEEAKLLVDTDPSGVMKKDTRSLRELLSAPP